MVYGDRWDKVVKKYHRLKLITEIFSTKSANDQNIQILTLNHNRQTLITRLLKHAFRHRYLEIYNRENKIFETEPKRRKTVLVNVQVVHNSQYEFNIKILIINIIVRVVKMWPNGRKTVQFLESSLFQN